MKAIETANAQRAPIAVWSTFSWWALWVGVAFFSVYPTCNWITAQRDPSSLFQFYTQAELRVPLVGQFIWIYLSMFVLFLMPPFFLDVPALVRLGKRLIAGTVFSGIIFLLFPARIGFARLTPEGPLQGALYQRLFALDLPYNSLPSLHVIFSATIASAIARSLGVSPLLRSIFYAWLGLICLSTLLVHQHHLADIATGLIVALLLQGLWTDSFLPWRKKACQ